MSRCVIVGGAKIQRYDRARSALFPDDFLIYCDSGLQHCDRLGRKPDLIVGDFDSHENPHLPVETIVLPAEKDDTDTVFAVKEALRRGFHDFLLLGVIGGRLDHTLGNVSILLMLDAIGGITGKIVDDYSEIEVVSRVPALVTDRYAFFSLLAMDGPVTGVYIEGAKYPLKDARIDGNYPYAVSNEVLRGCTARIRVGEGRLVLVKDF